MIVSVIQQFIQTDSCYTMKYSHFILQLQEHVTRNVEVAKEYVPFIVGKKHRNIERFETKSRTTIKVPSVQKSEGNELESFFIV